jgi:hypothetical protein
MKKLPYTLVTFKEKVKRVNDKQKWKTLLEHIESILGTPFSTISFMKRTNEWEDIAFIVVSLKDGIYKIPYMYHQNEHHQLDVSLFLQDAMQLDKEDLQEITKSVKTAEMYAQNMRHVLNQKIPVLQK